jgi:hypothetical protein
LTDLDDERQLFGMPNFAKTVFLEQGILQATATEHGGQAIPVPDLCNAC